MVAVANSIYTVLLVDDTWTDREQYRRYLRADTSRTYQFLEAASVAEGLEVYRAAKDDLTSTGRIDAILLDYSLPDAYGLMFLEALEAQNDSQAPPVIMATGSGDQRIAARAMKLGAADYLVKQDLTPGLLQRSVSSAIELSQSRQKLQHYHSRLETMHGQMTQIWESMTDAYVTVDREWSIIYANQTATKIILHLTQAGPSAFLGQSVWDMFPSLVGQWIEQEFNRAVAEQVPVHLELHYEATGDWFEIHAYPSLVGLGIYFRDITDRKQSELALETSARKFRVIFEQASELIGLLSRDGTLLEVNQAALDSIGVLPSEIIGKSFWETPWWHTEELQQQLRAAIVTAAGGQQIRYEVRFPNASGSWQITDFSLKPVIDESGQVGMIIAEAYDITDRKQTEEALRQSEEFKQRMLESSQDCIKVLNLDGQLLYMNVGGQCLLEIDDITPYLNTAWIGFWDSGKQQASQALAKAIAGEPELFYGYCPTTTGRPKWWEVMVSPIWNGSKQVEQVLVVSRDITARKQAEQSLQESEERLKVTVHELEERNQELDNFVYIVSHDLKAPLRGIANLSQWIEDDLKEASLLPQTQEQMTLLRSRVHRMSATIDGLLDYARIGHTSEIIELVSVAELLAETIDSLAPPSTFTIVISPPLPILNTNRLFLSQVFANLISNSIKHHDRSDGNVYISSVEYSDSYRFFVVDDGPGIALEDHNKIFAIFEAVNPKSSSDSTGIGLSIVKKIVEISGGSIQVESAIGKGATFSFTWPKQQPT
jgi:PAS domain S-box-containing protein